MPKPAVNAPPSGAARYRNRATLNVLAVLSRFTGSERACGVTELGKDLGMTKNMVHRALATLLEAGYVARAALGGRYQLGHRVLELRDDDSEEFDLRTLCRPFLEELHALSGESVFLSIIVGRSRVNIDSIHAAGRRVGNSQRGRAVPLHYLQMSRMLLAYLSDAEIEEYIRAAAPLDRYPETPGDTPAKLRKDVRAIRRQGYVVWRGRSTFSAAYVSFPVPDGAGRAHGVLTVGGPLERFTLKDAERLMPAIVPVMERLHRQSRLFPANPVFL